MSDHLPAHPAPCPKPCSTGYSGEYKHHGADADAPLVTVVTATYNLISGGREALFRACVESIHGQSYAKIEHIVIDGASTDGTLGVLDEYAAKGWIRYRSEPDAGIYDAMNKGVSMASGKYVAFLNSDDLWHDIHGVEESVRRLEESGADFSYAPYILEWSAPPFRMEQFPNLGSFPVASPFCHQTMFTRLELLRKAGGFDAASYKIAADYALIIKILLMKAVPVYVPLTFTTFRMGGVSATHRDAMHGEFSRARKAAWGDVLPADELERMGEGWLSTASLGYLASAVHGKTALALQEAYTQTPEGRYKCTQFAATIPETYTRRTPVLSLFGLPVLTKEEKAGPEPMVEKKWKLFGFLPLWGCRARVGSKYEKSYLFGVIQLHKRKLPCC